MVWNRHGHHACRKRAEMRCIVCVLLGMLVAGGAGAVPATIDYIFDGDTFAAIVHVDNDIDVPARVRLMNVDTPEMNGGCAFEIEKANRARDELAEILPIGSTVELLKIKDDKYLGRIDAYVRTADGRDVGQILIKAGLGRSYSGGRRTPWCQ